MISRLRFALKVNMLVAVVAIVYFRVFEAHLVGIVNNHPGPFSSVIGNVQAIVPLVFMIALLFANGYIIYGTVQRERVREVRQVRRR